MASSRAIRNFVTPQQAQQQYGVNITNATSATGWSFYDSNAYPAAGIGQLLFFQNQIGSGTGFGGGAKTLSDTNMTLSSQIPSGQNFLVQSVEIRIQPTTPGNNASAAGVVAQLPAAFGAQAVAQIINDVYFISRSGNVVMKISSMDYFQDAPLGRFPSDSNFTVEGALADISTTGANLQSRNSWATNIGDPWQVLPALLLPSNMNFNVTCNWPEGLQPITNPARLFVHLNGILYRNVQ